LSIYYGYPMNDVVYISFMCIGNEYQSQGYGRAVINQFIIELLGQNYNEIRVNVSLKNWPCLLFWSKLGFDKINGIYGDKEYSESTYANMELSRLLK
jgi:ribosomal protein S18 acetylase RimI-like enzyme